MSEAEAAINSRAEAIRGYMRDRTNLLKERKDVNICWKGYDDFCTKLNQDIAWIDGRVKELLEADLSQEKRG